MPAGPEPITATLRPLRNDGGSGLTQPFSNAWSMMRCSICLIVTASSLMSRTHAASHGAGQMRPVNSGKLLVACSASMASRQRSRKTRSFQSGIRLPSGQPEWQNGMPQSMQRAPCSRSCGSACGSAYSFKSFSRSSIGRLRGSTRWSLRKPPSSPMGREDLLLRFLFDLSPFAVRSAALSGILPGALCRRGGVLVLAGFAGPPRLLVAVRGDVGVALARADRTGAVAVAVLGDDLRLARLDRLALGQLAQRALVVHRHDLDPGRAKVVPVVEDALGHGGTGALAVLLDQRADLGEVVVARILEVDDLLVAALRELALRVEHERHAAAHARREVAAGRAEHDHAAAGHVLAAVIADALDDRAHARVAHGEALAGQAAEERAARGRAVEQRVADDDVRLRGERDVLRGPHGQHAAGHALPRV